MLENAIRDYLNLHNQSPRPFCWTKSADEILSSVARFCQRTSVTQHEHGLKQGFRSWEWAPPSNKQKRHHQSATGTHGNQDANRSRPRDCQIHAPGLSGLFTYQT